MVEEDVIEPGDLKWFEICRRELAARWRARVHYEGDDGEMFSLACRLADAASPPMGGHLSISCSLAVEADEIAAFLEMSAFDDQPLRFLRFYLFLLDEFVNQLEAACKTIGAVPPNPPKALSTWTNKFAKHKFDLLRQHHPKYFFEDNPHSAGLRDRLDDPRILLIEAKTLVTRRDSANTYPYCVMVVPPLAEFLEPAIVYYETVVGRLAEVGSGLSTFHSVAHDAEMSGLRAVLLGPEGPTPS